MRMPFSARLLCFTLLTTSLAACSSRNPLMDETPTAATANSTTSQTTATSASAPAAASDTHTSGPTGLARILGKLSPYRIDVQQGNFVTREMVNQLREGMQRPEGVTREQVRFVMGTPLLTDLFHNDRWDYLFRLQKRNGEVVTSHVSVFFENNRLKGIEGGNLPTEKEYLTYITGTAPDASSADKH